MTIDNVIGRLPDSVLEESPVIELKGWIIDALKLLPTVGTHIQKIKHFEIINGKVILPKEIKLINSVLWQHKDFTIEDCSSLSCETPYEVRDHICKPLIYFSIFLDSSTLKNNYSLLKYIGKDKSLVCKDCPNINVQCNDTFIVTSDNVLYTSFDEGFICVNYDTIETDDNGSMIIDDNENVNQFLINYTTFRSLEKRMLNGSNVAALYDRYNQQKDIWYRKAKGSIMLRSADLDKLQEVKKSSLFKLLKVSNTNDTFGQIK